MVGVSVGETSLIGARWRLTGVILPALKEALVLVFGPGHLKSILSAKPLEVIYSPEVGCFISYHVRFVIEVSPLLYIFYPFLQPSVKPHIL